MSNRHLSRKIVLQSLFEWDFKGEDNLKIDSILNYNMTEFSSGLGDLKFSKKIIKNIFENRDAIDNIITKAAPQWPIEKISLIELLPQTSIKRINLQQFYVLGRKQYSYLC